MPMAKHNKTTGERALLVSEKTARITLNAVILTGQFGVYASFKFCVMVCGRVPLCYSIFFMSFMT
jgi:uncharacterized MnhB-related membrane protein